MTAASKVAFALPAILRSIRTIIPACVVAASLTLMPASVSAQCPPEWRQDFGVPGVDNGTVHAVALLPGGDLLVGGSFTSAGGVPANNLARYSPATSTWAAMGAGANGPVYAMRIVHDFSPNQSIIVGGSFSTVAGVPASNIIRFTVTSNTWAPIGAGINGPVYALGGSYNASEFFVGGAFSVAGTTPANNVAEYRYGNYVALASGTNGPVYAFTFTQNGDLMVGGSFSTAGGVHAGNIARWGYRFSGNSNTWPSSPGVGTNGPVRAMLTLTNWDIVVGGSFTSAGGQPMNHIARYAPSNRAWNAMGAGTDGDVLSLSARSAVGIGQTYFTDIIAGGSFASAGGTPAGNIAAFSFASGAWSPLGVGTNGPVHLVQRLRDEEFLIAGAFTASGGSPAHRIAQYVFEPLPYVTSVDRGGVCPTSAVDVVLSAYPGSAAYPQPVTYQWRKDSVPIAVSGPGGNPSAATSLLQLAVFLPSDQGWYDCIVSSPCGSTLSLRTFALIDEAFCPTTCDSLDYNNDGIFPDTLDIDDLLSVFGGGPCSNPAGCNDIDFNNDGLSPDSADIDCYLGVFAGGACGCH